MNHTTVQLLELAKKHLMFITVKPDIVMAHGKGMYLFDTDGKKYLDFVGGWAVTSLGHSPEVLAKALEKQSKRLVSPSPSFYNDLQIKFAKMITEISCMDKVFFASAGSEANEGAIKLARKYGSLHKDGAFEIITTEHGFHGRTLATMSASGKVQWDNLFEPKVPGFIKVPFNDLKAVENAINPKTIAVMIEPIQGESGVYPADLNYVHGLRKLCDEKNVLLIFDEIQTGMARTGKMFAYEHYNIEPDIMTLAKGIGSGFPLSALLAKEKFCCFEKGDQGGTYTGQSLAMAAGIAVLNEIINKHIVSKVADLGEYLRDQLVHLEAKTGISNVRGLGLLMAFDLPKPNSDAFVAEALKKGLLLNGPRQQTIRLMPSLIAEKKHIDAMIVTLEKVFDSLKN